jgi:hypothetical protein
MNKRIGNVWTCGNGKLPGWLARTGLPGHSLRLAPVKSDCCVILYGEDLNEQDVRHAGGWRMNGAAKNFAALPVGELERRLSREGLSSRIGTTAKEGQAAGFRRFGATAFDLTEADVRRRYSNRDGLRGSAAPDERIRKIVSRACVKALYALGLDFGHVEADLDDEGRPIIVSVSAVPRPEDEEGERRLAAVVSAFASRWEEELASGASVTLGADPEFVLFDGNGKIVPASRYFQREGDAGCDSVVIRGVRRFPLAELRPSPSPEPDAVLADVRRLLASAARRTAGEPLVWRAGGMPARGLPLGGHVHLSGAALTGERLRALDNAVALPLRLLEPPAASERRPRYGALGDFRRQSHGGFEYRTPPSWLVSPRLARGVLALAKVGAEHARELAAAGRPLDDEAVRDAYYAGDRATLREAVRRVHDALSRTSGYAKYRQAIEPIFGAVADRKRWDERADIRTKWRIPIR